MKYVNSLKIPMEQMLGFGIGLGYPVLIIVSMRWFVEFVLFSLSISIASCTYTTQSFRFPNSKAKVCGLISAVFGASPMLWDFIETKIVNPNGVPVDPLIGYAHSPEMIHQIPYLFLKIACIQIAMQFIGFLGIRNPPWYIPERQQTNLDRQASSEQLIYEKHSLTVQMSLKSPVFWSLWVCMNVFDLCVLSTRIWFHHQIDILLILS